MSDFAQQLTALLPTLIRSAGAGGLTTAANVRNFESRIIEAVGALEIRARGSRIFNGQLYGQQPDPALGLEGDMYIEIDTLDVFLYVDGVWGHLINLMPRQTTFVPVAANAYGTHPAFATERDWLIWLTQRTSNVVTPPTPAPTITGFLPLSGARGSTVVISGANFTGATVVSVNSGAVASFNVDSATQITAVLSSSQATGKVRVTTPRGTAVSATDFTVTTSTTAFSLLPQASDYFYNNNYFVTDQIIGGRKKYNPFAVLKLSVSAPGTISVPITTTDAASKVTVFKDGLFHSLLSDNNPSLVVTAAGLYELSLGTQSRYNDAGDITFSSIGTITAPASMGVSHIAPTDKARVLITYTDSVGVGGALNDASRDGWHQRVRELNADTNVVVLGYAGRTAHVGLSTPALRAIQVENVRLNCVNISSPRLWLQMGINDWNLSTASPTDWAAEIKAFFQELHAVIPSLNIFWASPTPITNTGANNFSKYIEDYRTAAAAAAIGMPYVLYVNGLNLNVTTADLNDNAHFTEAGCAKLGTAISSIYNNTVFPIAAPAGATFSKYTLSDTHVQMLPSPSQWVQVPDGGGGNLDIGYSTEAGSGYRVNWVGVRIEIYTTKQANGQSITISQDGAASFQVDTAGPGYPTTPELVYQSPDLPSGSHTTLVMKENASSINFYYVKVYTS